MRKNYLLSIGSILILAVIAIGAIGCESLSPPSTTSSSGDGSIFSQQNTGIWVTGEGKVSVAPDTAILSLGIEAQAATVAEAQEQAAGAMEKIFDELGNLGSYGISSKDTKTRNFSIYPVRKWIEDKGEEALIGYRVTNTITAKIIFVDNTGIIIDTVTKAGGDYIRIDGITFTVDDPTPYYKEARDKAMADAKAKAKQLADSGGVKLGDPTYINESSVSIPVTRDILDAASKATTPISPGETDIRLTVQVVYSIR